MNSDTGAKEVGLLDLSTPYLSRESKDPFGIECSVDNSGRAS